MQKLSVMHHNADQLSTILGCFFLWSYFSFFSFFAHSQEPRLVLPIGHTDNIRSADLSSDGKLLMTLGENSIRIWERNSGMELLEKIVTNCVSANFVSSNRIKLIEFDGSERIYDLESWELLETKEKSIFNFDSTLVLNYSVDKTSELFLATISDLNTGKKIQEFKSLNAFESEFSPVGDLIKNSSVNDGIINVYNVFSGQIVKTINVPKEVKINYSRFSPDGKKVIVLSNDGIARFYDLTSESVITIKCKYDQVNFAVFSPDNNLIFIDSGGIMDYHEVGVFNLATGEEICVIEGFFSLSFYDGVSIDISPDGKLVLISCSGGRAGIFEIPAGHALHEWVFEDYPTMKFSQDGKLALVSGDNITRLFDISLKKDIQIFGGQTVTPRNSFFSKDGKQVKSIFSDNTLHKYEVETSRIKENTSLPKELNFTSIVYNSDSILGLFVDTMVRIYNLDMGKEIQCLNTGSKNILSAYFCPNSINVLTQYNDGTIRIYDLQSGKELPFFSADKINTKCEYAVYSPNGKLLVTQSRDSIVRIIDAFTGNILQTISNVNIDSQLSDVFSSESNLILLFGFHTAMVYDVFTGRILKLLIDEQEEWICGSFSLDNKLIIVESENEICVFNVSNGSLLTRLARIDGIYPGKLSPNGKYFYNRGYQGVNVIYNLETGDKILGFSESNFQHTFTGEYSPNSKYLLTNTNDHKSILWEVDTGKKLYTRIQLKNNEWLVYDEDYHFDGSEGAIDYLYLVCGLEVVDLAQVKDSLYVPGLVSKIMNKVPLMRDGKPIPKLSDLNICNLTPIVEPQEPVKSGELRYRITPRNGGLGNTEVYINGNLTFTFPKNTLTKLPGNSKTECYELALNMEQLRPYLISSDSTMRNPLVVKSKIEKGSIYSRGVTQLLEYAEKGPLPRFYGVFIGVDEYGNPEKHSGDGRYRNLDYAAKDANDLSNAIESSAGKLFETDQVQIFRLTGKAYPSPTKEAIQGTLDSIGKLANANDVLFIFFAGHGDIKKSAENKNEMCFLTERATIDDKLGFSVAELMEWCKPQNIKAQKRVFVFDACHSGQAVKDFNDLAFGRGEDEDTRILQLTKLRDKNGMMIMAASAANEFAYEDPTLQQGVLTYHLLNAIKNNASELSSQGDSLIVIREWFDEVIKEVGVYTQRNAQAQTPTSFGDGWFYIGKITSDVQSKINVPAQKVRMGKSVFVAIDDAITWCPDLDRQINMQLSSASGLGGYVYTERDGYYAKGSYKIQKKKIIVSYALFKGDEMLSKQPVVLKPVKQNTAPHEVVNLIKDSIEQELMKLPFK